MAALYKSKLTGNFYEGTRSHCYDKHNDETQLWIDEALVQTISGELDADEVEEYFNDYYPETKIKRVLCDCCENAYYDFVLTDKNISENPMYVCTMCSDDMEKRNHEFDKGNKEVCMPFYTNQEIEKFHADFAEFKKTNEVIDFGNR